MFSTAYKRYVLGTLTLVSTLGSLDQSLMTLMAEPIKEHLQLSDSQLGFLTGIAFALLYATLGVPFARWSDRGNRVTITSIAMGLWGLAVMSCLLVSNFVQLAVARIAAGAAASGSMPPTYSLLGDYFPAPAERIRVMAIYMLSGPIGALLSYAAGGWLNEHYDWRVAFFAMGLPGALIAVLVKLTLHEPRTRIESVETSAHALPRMIDVVTILWHQRASRHLSLAFIFFFTLTGGMAPWCAAFLIRSHGLATGELGVWFGLIFGLSGTVGVWLGGYISEHWFGEDERGQVRMCALLIASLVLGYALFLLSGNKAVALTALGLLIAAGNFVVGPTFALLQRLVTAPMRATTMALIMLAANLIGMGIGPQIVGILSDALKPLLGGNSLRYAMLATSWLALWSAYHFWQVGRTVRADLSAVHRDSPGEANTAESPASPANLVSLE
jgi:MFS family permease